MRELEAELRELGAELRFPPTPDLATPVRLRIAAAPARRFLGARRALVVALAVLAVAVGAVLAVPQARTAVLEWLGLRGVTVERAPTTPTAPQADDLGLGERVTLAEARRRVDFGVVAPRLGDLGEADEVYVGFAAGGEVVGLVWRAADGEAEAIFTQFPGSLEHEVVRKVAGPGTTVEELSVDGGRALWLEGAPHVFAYVTPEGVVVEETLRLAGNTLLWERGELTLRLEGDLTRDEALRIAASAG